MLLFCSMVSVASGRVRRKPVRLCHQNVPVFSTLHLKFSMSSVLALPDNLQDDTVCYLNSVYGIITEVSWPLYARRVAVKTTFQCH